MLKYLGLNVFQVTNLLIIDQNGPFSKRWWIINEVGN